MAKRSYRRKQSNRKRRSTKRGGYEDPVSHFRRTVKGLTESQFENVLEKLNTHINGLNLSKNEKDYINKRLNSILNNARVNERVDRIIDILSEIHTENELRTLFNEILGRY